MSKVRYAQDMRFATPLHTSRRRHALSSRTLTVSAALGWLTLGGIAVFAIVQLSGLNQGSLLGGFLMSLGRTSVAYVIALVASIVIALSITANPIVERILLPIFDVLQSFPSFALFPILVNSLQRSPELVILVVLALEIIWPILFSIIGGMKNRREELEEAATIFGARGWRRIWVFTLPELLPSIVTGSIVGWGEGWEVIIGAELLVSVHQGIGRYFGILGNSGQSTLLAAGIGVLMILLFLINKLIWLPLLHDVSAYETET